MARVKVFNTVELIREIFEYLPQGDLARCALVCKGWTGIAEEALFGKSKENPRGTSKRQVGSDRKSGILGYEILQ